MTLLNAAALDAAFARLAADPITHNLFPETYELKADGSRVHYVFDGYLCCSLVMEGERFVDAQDVHPDDVDAGTADLSSCRRFDTLDSWIGQVLCDLDPEAHR